ncbi:C-type lectin protein [Ranid herpesvirus 3]|uniref:C-type lectin protein n=1 Tax=Ranid herpesvirus 3 TaxID=1987509 RepID=A0A1X9T5I1_9VIRU|nr:C-type lectin protein [Ranid herpesvirus 3]ARR28960.1 C-type lectin protein [Ranid herpesvirus 3]
MAPKSIFVRAKQSIPFLVFCFLYCTIIIFSALNQKNIVLKRPYDTVEVKWGVIPKKHSACMDNWVRYKNRCYGVTSSMVTYEHMLLWCGHMKADPVVLQSPEDAGFLNALSRHQPLWVRFTVKNPTKDFRDGHWHMRMENTLPQETMYLANESRIVQSNHLALQACSRLLCPVGWSIEGNFCFYLYRDKPRNNSAAAGLCRLTTNATPFNSLSLAVNVLSRYDQNIGVWSGVCHQSNANRLLGLYRPEDGEYGEQKNCTVNFRDGNISVSDKEKHFTLCTIPIISEPHSIETFGNGWQVYKTRLYFIGDKRVTFRLNAQLCEEMMADMVLFDSPNDIAGAKFMANVWLGLEERTFGKWIWSNGLVAHVENATWYWLGSKVAIEGYKPQQAVALHSSPKARLVSHDPLERLWFACSKPRPL